MISTFRVEAMRALIFFAALSFGIHLIVLIGMPFELERAEPGPVPLQARLEPLERRAVSLQRSKKKPAAAAAPAERTFAAPIAPDAPTDAIAEQNETQASATVSDVASNAPKSEIRDEPALSAVVPVARLPRYGAITYDVYLGNDRFNIGRTQQAWTLTDDGYRLTSLSETTGLASVFSRQQLSYESIGKLTAHGLQPEFFAARRVRTGKSEEATADFDWEAMTVRLRKAREQKDVALPPATQDMMSFMYQLGLLPLTRGRIELAVTNGSKLERYELDVGAEEFLQTPLGVLRALPVKQVRRPGQESIELWLASEHRLLPVRIRFFDRQGSPSGEQVVSQIRVSDD